MYVFISVNYNYIRHIYTNSLEYRNVNIVYRTIHVCSICWRNTTILFILLHFLFTFNFFIFSADGFFPVYSIFIHNHWIDANEQIEMSIHSFILFGISSAEIGCREQFTWCFGLFCSINPSDKFSFIFFFLLLLKETKRREKKNTRQYARESHENLFYSRNPNANDQLNVWCFDLFLSAILSFRRL